VSNFLENLSKNIRLVETDFAGIARRMKSPLPDAGAGLETFAMMSICA
jgi:hypothetical protein